MSAFSALTQEQVKQVVDEVSAIRFLDLRPNRGLHTPESPLKCKNKINALKGRFFSRDKY